MARFSKATIKHLKKAGWYPGRSVDLTPIIAALHEEGFEIFPVVEDFLKEFGDLRINYPGEWGIGEIDLTVINQLDRDGIDELVLNRCAQRIGKPLCIIGIIEQDTLMMSSDGNIYSEFWPDISCIGQSGDEFLDKTIVLKGKYGVPVD